MRYFEGLMSGDRQNGYDHPNRHEGEFP